MLCFIQSFLFLVDLLDHNITLTDSVSWNQRELEDRSVMDFKVLRFLWWPKFAVSTNKSRFKDNLLFAVESFFWANPTSCYVDPYLLAFSYAHLAPEPNLSHPLSHT
jgi:hypothetical protein